MQQIKFQIWPVRFQLHEKFLDFDVYSDYQHNLFGAGDSLPCRKGVICRNTSLTDREMIIVPRSTIMDPPFLLSQIIWEMCSLFMCVREHVRVCVHVCVHACAYHIQCVEVRGHLQGLSPPFLPLQGFLGTNPGLQVYVASALTHWAILLHLKNVLLKLRDSSPESYCPSWKKKFHRAVWISAIRPAVIYSVFSHFLISIFIRCHSLDLWWWLLCVLITNDMKDSFYYRSAMGDPPEDQEDRWGQCPQGE